ncbi:MAG: hypothetical protein K1000chlam1_00846 [Candidatus Anoxychlamydiales bacterium]|nr:hypothetical protein [Candidatus Anoxychlamydiales bacterium]
MTSRLSAVFGYEGLVKDGSVLSRSQKKYIVSAICLGGFLVTREYSGMVSTAMTITCLNTAVWCVNGMMMEILGIIVKEDTNFSIDSPEIREQINDIEYRVLYPLCKKLGIEQISLTGGVSYLGFRKGITIAVVMEISYQVFRLLRSYI